MNPFDEYDNEGLQTLRTEKHTAFQTLTALEAPTVAQVDEATALRDEIRSIDAEMSRRTAEAADAAERFEALRNETFEVETEASEDAEVEVEAEADTEEAEAEVEVEAEAEGTEVAASLRQPASKAQRIARRTPRPATPEREQSRVTITAAADVDGFASGSTISTLGRVGDAVVAKMKSFGVPSGSGEGEDLRFYPVAKFAADYDPNLVIDRGSDDMAVLNYAANESRLSSEHGSGSLTAAAGWCAPSETIYDLCTYGTLDGILSAPEVQVKRGGIKYTRGADFATLYSNTGFTQTEAQAIAGTSKPCYEVPCPSFTEERLDAIGLCIKVPILLNAAYPEVVEQVTSGSMIAHAHRVNAAVLSKQATALGAARVFAGLGSSASDTIEALNLVADQRRQVYRMGLNETLEVVVPFWVKNVLKADVSRRSARDTAAVTDAEIASMFSANNLNVQYVYDWQTIDESAEVYPATFNAQVYPAGTFVKGVSDVINLSAVYDAASLAVNTYTGLFMEQGLLVARMCYAGDLVTIPICTSGETGSNSLVCV